jgi:hypothetical protein
MIDEMLTYVEFCHHLSESLDWMPALDGSRQYSFADELAVDSIAMLEIVLAAEDAGVLFDEEDLATLASIRDLYERYRAKATLSQPTAMSSKPE